MVDRAEVSVIEGLFFNRGVTSVRNWWMSVKSVRDRGVLITELKKETDWGFFFVHNCRLSGIEGSVIEGFYCSLRFEVAREL